ncbi:MAG: hypothetical protein ACLQF0_07710 [Dissulfurispiraceae bacterium]
MQQLDKYPDLMTPGEVAEVLGCRPVTVPRLRGLMKAYVLNGRKKFKYRKQDVIDYINSKVEKREVIEIASKQKKGHRKMGLPTLLPWEELQKA